MKKYKNILVTGGAGFIGSYLVDALIKTGYSVTILDNLEEQVHQGKKPKYLNKKAKLLKGDIRNHATLKRVLRTTDVIYHLASSVGVAQSNYEIKKYADVNVAATADLLDIIVNSKLPIKKIVSVSSMTGYGEGNYFCKICGTVRPPTRSQQQLNQRQWELFCPNCKKQVSHIATGEKAQEYPNSIYAITKKAQTDMLMVIGQIYQIPTVLLKLFNVYGPRQSLSNPYTGVTAIFMSRIKNGQPALLYEDGLQTRDFVSVHDVVRALVLVLKTDKADYETLNIGSGIPTPIKKIAKILAKEFGKPSLVEITGNARVNDTRHCYADIRKAKRLLNWKPRIKLKNGIEELVAWGEKEEAEDNFSKAEQELKRRNIQS